MRDHAENGTVLLPCTSNLPLIIHKGWRTVTTSGQWQTISTAGALTARLQFLQTGIMPTGVMQIRTLEDAMRMILTVAITVSIVVIGTIIASIIIITAATEMLMVDT